VSRTEDERVNEASWDATADAYQERHREQLGEHGAAWGIWQVPEAEVRALGDVAGRDVVELGCGAAQWAIALAGRARVRGIDLSSRQLQHARRAVADAGVAVDLVHGSVTELPFDDAAFDVAFCDHGGLTFADPHRAIPEAARVLRPGGRLAFCGLTPLIELCWPAEADVPSAELQRDYWTLGREAYEDQVQWNLPYGAWIASSGRADSRSSTSSSCGPRSAPRRPTGATTTAPGRDGSPPNTSGSPRSVSGANPRPCRWWGRSSRRG
jgi:SAM-dependent methyltransferase